MNMESNEKPLINRIKVVLVEQRRTNKWLADTLHTSEAKRAIGETLDWMRLDGKKTSTVDLYKKCDFTKKSSQTELFEWLKEYTERFVSFFKPIIKKL